MQADEVIFTVDRMAYVWEDVVIAGHVWGDWTTLEQRVRDGLACLARLDDVDDDALDEADVDAAACDFRYARDLVAASDLEAWLERRGVTIDAWLDFIRRSLLLRRWANDLDEIRAAYELDEDEVAEAVRALIAARQLDWMRFTVQTVLAPDVEVAREVTLCVREDGRPIEQVAAAARLRAETIEWWLEDVEPAVREALVGAMPGDVLGPLALKEGHLILAVGNKRLT